MNTERYYFNLVTRTCTTFTYQGCEGSGNNFGTLAQCQNFCNSAGACFTYVILEAFKMRPNCSVRRRRGRLPRPEHAEPALVQPGADEQLPHRLLVPL